MRQRQNNTSERRMISRRHPSSESLPDRCKPALTSGREAARFFDLIIDALDVPLTDADIESLARVRERVMREVAK